ncbi:MAG TPA: helix-turn-helix transcriptional regulator [Gammaproteobacteria bacterium]
MARLEQQFGKKLRELRKARGLTQEQLAEKVNVSYQAISNIERGLTGPSFPTLAEIAKALKAKPKDLFDF